MRRYVLLLGALLAIGAQNLAAQTVDIGLVDTLTGAPVAGARVAVAHICCTPADHDPLLMLFSDLAGHLRMADLPPGDYSLNIQGPGHLNRNQYVYLNPGAQQPAQNLRLGLTPEAVISGTVQDEDGFPAADVRVEAIYYRSVNGRRVASSWSGVTDDRGRYRIANVPPELYYLRAAPAGRTAAWDGRYVAQYANGSLQGRAGDRIEVKAGEEHSGMDFHLRKFEGSTISGRITFPAAADAATRTWTADLYVDDLLFGPSARVQNQDGAFIFTHVPPGNYTVRVHSGTGAKPGEFAVEQPLQVAGDVRDLALTAHAVQASDLHGVIHFEGGARARSLQFELRDPLGASITASTKSDGTFVFPKVPAGHYEFMNLALWREERTGMASPAGPVTTVSMRLGDKDVLHQYLDLDGSPTGPLEIAVGPAVAAAKGDVRVAVRDRWGQAALGAMVLVAPPKPAASYATVVDTSATLHLFLLTPGNYRVYAVANDSETGAFQDPDWMAAHEGDFTPLRINPGSNPPVTLTLSGK